MVHTSVVHIFKGNNKTIPKVDTFGFPKDEELKREMDCCYLSEGYSLNQTISGLFLLLMYEF